MDALWRLTALPRDEFEATYGAMLGRLWRYVSASGGRRVVRAEGGGADQRGGRAARARRTTAPGWCPLAAANVFRAELADGRRVEGMVFPGELIWDDEAPAETAGALGGRRR